MEGDVKDVAFFFYFLEGRKKSQQADRRIVRTGKQNGYYYGRLMEGGWKEE